MGLEPVKLSDFHLGGTLGSGATAKVYDAVHTTTGRPVAIKLMERSDAGAEIRERFAREALLLANVSSRHVGKIIGFGFDRGQPFLVLERLDGETLDAKLRRDGPVPVKIAIRWIEELIIGIRDCHDANVIHRDVKPSNIFLHREGFEEKVKLIDFGVARLREIAGDPTGLTGHSHLLGSMGYMAPEQFVSAKSVGFPADVYAAGVVIFRTLTGRLPFVSRSLEAVVRMKSEHRVPAISSMPGMPQNAALDWFVDKAVTREPEGRFRSAREMLDHWWNVMTSLEGPNASADRVVTPKNLRGDTVPPVVRLSEPPEVEELTIRRAAVTLSSSISASDQAPPSITLAGVTTRSELTRSTDDLPPQSTTVAAAQPPTLPYPEGADDTTAMSRGPVWSDPRLPVMTPMTPPDPRADEPLEDMDNPDSPDAQTTRTDPELRLLIEEELARTKAPKES